MSDFKLRRGASTITKSRIIVMNKIPDRSDMIFDLLGKKKVFFLLGEKSVVLKDN